MRELWRGTHTIFARELAAYFDSPIAYIVGAVFLILSGLVFMNGFFLDGVVDMTPYFRVLPLLLIAFVPAITMRSWAEERSLHTFELLMTLPITTTQIILGKFGAALCFYAVILAGTLPIVVMLLSLGTPDLGLITAGYAGALLLGALFLSFGLFASGLTRDQIVAFVLAALIGFALVLSGHDKVVEVLDGLAPPLELGTKMAESLSVLPHYQAFIRGLVSLADALYFLLMSAFFLWMNELTLRRSRM